MAHTDCTQLLHVQDRKVRAIAKAAGVMALTLCIHGGAAAQTLEDLRISVGYTNNFSSGYDRSRHTYDADWFRTVVADPPSRQIVANVCPSFATGRIRMDPLDDGIHCSDEEARLAPEGASALVWTVSGPHPHLNKIVELKQERKLLHDYKALPGSRCMPLERKKVVEDDQCQIKFDAPTPSREVANVAESYSVRFEVVDGANQVLASRSQSVPVPRRVPLIVSVGESLAAGEGNPDMPGDAADAHFDPLNQHDCEDDTSVMLKFDLKPSMLKQPFWMEPRDHRSLRSGPALAAKQLLTEWPYIAFLSFAKSGSVISSPEADNDILEQLEHVRRVVGNQRIDALHISAGGNDVGFSDVLKTMAGDFRGSDAEKVLSHFMDKLLKLRDEGYPKIDAKIKELGLNIGQVLINEYPGSLFNDENDEPTKGCGVFDTSTFWSVSKRDAVAIRNMGNLLNAEVKLAANTHGWHLVDGISEKFAGHGYCSGQSFYRFAAASCDTQGDFDGTMHPNEEGTAAYARVLARELRKVLPKPGQGPVHGPGQGPGQGPVQGIDTAN